MTYRSLIEPYFWYCCPVWGSANSKTLQKLQKLQNRGARIFTSSLYDAHSETLIKHLGWRTIKQFIHKVKIVFKTLHIEAPECLKELFYRLSGTKNRDLRNSKTNLIIPLLRTSSGQRALPTGEYAFGTTLHMKQYLNLEEHLLTIAKNFSWYWYASFS